MADAGNASSLPVDAGEVDDDVDHVTAELVRLHVTGDESVAM